MAKTKKHIESSHSFGVEIKLPGSNAAAPAVMPKAAASVGALFVEKRKADKRNPADQMESSVIKVENPRNIYGLYISEFSGMTPDKLHRYLQMAQKGLCFYKSLFFDEMRRRDLRLAAICQTRKMGVAGKEYEIAFSPESDVPESQQDEILQFINNVIAKLKITNLITDIVEAELQGVCTFEINWMVSDGSDDIPAGKVIIKSIDLIPNYLLCFDDRENKYRYLDTNKADAQALRTVASTTQDRINLSGIVMEDVNPLKLLEVHALDGNAQNGFLNGCIDSLTWAYIFKNYGLKDYATYVERLSTPAIVGKYPPLMSANDRAALKSAVENFGHLMRLLIPESADIDILSDSSKSSTKNLFDEYIAYWNKEMSIRVLGQDLTTSSGDDGSRALGEVHNEVRADLVLADMMLVTDAMNELIRRIMYFNFPGVKEFPRWSYVEKENIEYKKARAEIFSSLHGAGWQVSAEDIETEFGVTVEPVTQTEPGAGLPLSQLPAVSNNTVQHYIAQFINKFRKETKSKKPSWLTRTKRTFSQK